MIQFDEHVFQMGWFNHQLVANLRALQKSHLMTMICFGLKASNDRDFCPTSRCKDSVPVFVHYLKTLVKLFTRKTEQEQQQRRRQPQRQQQQQQQQQQQRQQQRQQQQQQQQQPEKIWEYNMFRWIAKCKFKIDTDTWFQSQHELIRHDLFHEMSLGESTTTKAFTLGN